MHAVCVCGIHDGLYLFDGNVASEDGLLFAAIVDETAVETHEQKARFQKAVLFRQLLGTRERTTRADDKLLSRINHRADGTHVGIRDALVISQQGSVQVRKEYLHHATI